jgi:hypothetical protein
LNFLLLGKAGCINKSSGKPKATTGCTNDPGPEEFTMPVVLRNAFVTCLALGWGLYSFVQQPKGFIKCSQDANF